MKIIGSKIIGSAKRACLGLFPNWNGWNGQKTPDLIADVSEIVELHCKDVTQEKKKRKKHTLKLRNSVKTIVSLKERRQLFKSAKYLTCRRLDVTKTGQWGMGNEVVDTDVHRRARWTG